MAILVTHVNTQLDQSESEIVEAARVQGKIRNEEIAATYLVKTSVDARRRDKIHLVSSVSFEVKGDEQAILGRNAGSDSGVSIQNQEKICFAPPRKAAEHPPVIVGFGPAGMFAGLALARMGYKPLILERGACVEERVVQVNQFWKNASLMPESNVQFGEGGAGTFSDGKLTTRIHDPRCAFVLDEMICHGAPEEIRYRAKPHVGTDQLRTVVKNIREEIIKLGGTILFQTKFEGLCLSNQKVTAVKTSQGEIPADAVILAIGHSARDTFQLLLDQGVKIEPKAFSVGLRVEQRQSVIDKGLYGSHAGHPALAKGEYQLSWKSPEEQGRGVYTFCMCPGGFVVPAASEEGGVVTNGMSEYARDAVNANSAIAVSVDSRDYGTNPLDGVRFQRELEKKAFLLGGGNYQAPAQSVKSFLASSKPDLSLPLTKPSYARGVREANLSNLFSSEINEMLKKGLRIFNNRLRGFADDDAVLTGVESRTSSPVRFPRNPESLQALGITGLYPSGEGAGYAGGIVSAAVDGIRVAEQLQQFLDALE